jgi:hypothetical protein
MRSRNWCAVAECRCRMPLVHRASLRRRYQSEPPPPPPLPPLPASPPPDEPPPELGAVEAAAIAVERPPPRSELKSAVSDPFQGWLPSYQSGWYWICEAANAAAKRRLQAEWSTPRGLQATTLARSPGRALPLRSAQLHKARRCESLSPMLSPLDEHHNHGAARQGSRIASSSVPATATPSPSKKQLPRAFDYRRGQLVIGERDDLITEFLNYFAVAFCKSRPL